MRLKLLVALYLSLTTFVVSAGGLSGALKTTCKGKFINPVTDINWENLFPIHIAGGITINTSSNRSPMLETVNPVCSCPGHLAPGIGTSLWEPVGVIESTDEAGCLHMLGGLQIYNAPELKGRNATKVFRSIKKQIHYYEYPVLNVLGMMTDFACRSKSNFSVGYMTEFDPLWNSSSFSSVFSPELTLFATKAGALACIADVIASSTKYIGPLDFLFWCNGHTTFSTLAGDTTGQSPADGYIDIAQKFVAKMHKEFIFWGSIGPWAVCQAVPTYFAIKSQYRFNPVWPRSRKSGQAITWGRSVLEWNVGDVYSKNTENGMSFLLWQDKQCCAGL